MFATPQDTSKPRNRLTSASERKRLAVLTASWTQTANPALTTSLRPDSERKQVAVLTASCTQTANPALTTSLRPPNGNVERG